jgi:alpha-glucosidase
MIDRGSRDETSGTAASTTAVVAAESHRIVERRRVEAGGVVLEVSAPRADIFRVRAGVGDLPEDASWAVDAEVRTRLTPMTMSEGGDGLLLSTGQASLHLDPVTLAITVRDGDGRVVLADAVGRALTFDPDGLGRGFRLRNRLPIDMHCFGLGDKTGPLDRRDGAFTLWNTDRYAYGVGADPLYKSIPFVLGVDEAGGCFGFFLDATWRSMFDFGKTEPDVFAVTVQGGGVDYYVMIGATPKAIVESYADLTGKPPLPPLWALGFHQSRWGYATQATVEEIAARLRADRIPTDALYLDIDFQDRMRPFTVDTVAFPDLPGLVARSAAMNLRLVAITDPHIAVAPGEGYGPYDDGMANDVFVRDADGEVFVGPVWPGPCAFPDFTRDEVGAWWGGLYDDFVAMGFAGFWNDMGEPTVFEAPASTMPLDAVHRIESEGFAPRTASHAEIHNVYGMLNSRATHRALLERVPDRRPFVLTRATFAGGQRWAATWTADNSSSWAHLKLSVADLVNLGLSGFAWVGADIGGFTGAPPSPELLTRWIEVGAFTPFFRIHYEKGKPAQEPWVGGVTHEDIRRAHIEERYRLLPYLYALAEEAARTGVPPMRPVFLEFPGVIGGGFRFAGTEGWFMLGACLLIAPPPAWESPASYRITLPGPGWYDYRSGALLDDPEVEEIPRLDRLPVFVRPGAVIPKQPLVQSTAETPVGPLTLEVYPGGDGRGTVYLDDGISFAHRTGDFLRRTVTCTEGAAGPIVALSACEGTHAPWWRTIAVVIHGQIAGTTVLLDGRPIAAIFDAARGAVRVDLPETGGAATLAIVRPAS